VAQTNRYLPLHQQLFRKIRRYCSNILVHHGCNPKGRVHIALLLDMKSEQAKKVFIHILENVC